MNRTRDPERLSHRAHRRVLQAGRPDPDPLEGLSGGTIVWEEIAAFFAALHDRARPVARRSMPDLEFRVEGAEVVPYAAAPLLAFRLARRATRSRTRSSTPSCSAARCRSRRPGGATTRDEEERLRDLFGEPERWGQTLRTMLWTHTSAVLPPFTGETVVRPAGALQL